MSHKTLKALEEVKLDVTDLTTNPKPIFKPTKSVRNSELCCATKSNDPESKFQCKKETTHTITFWYGWISLLFSGICLLALYSLQDTYIGASNLFIILSIKFLLDFALINLMICGMRNNQPNCYFPYLLWVIFQLMFLNDWALANIFSHQHDHVYNWLFGDRVEWVGKMFLAIVFLVFDCLLIYMFLIVPYRSQKLLFEEEKLKRETSEKRRLVKVV